MSSIRSFIWICIFLILLLQNADCKKKNKKKKDIWEFRFSLDGFPANFLNAQNQLVGQSVDIVERICLLANKKCNLSYVPRIECWDDSTYKASALENKEADVCANLVESPDRRIFYQFPNQSIYRIPNPILIRRPGDTRITLTNLKECNDFRLAYPALTALNRDCLISAGLFVKEENTVPIVAAGSIVDAIREIVNAVLENRADVGLVIPRLLFPPSSEQIEIVGESPCLNTLIGLNMMVKKNDERGDEFISWWNPTLKRFICGSDKFPNIGQGVHVEVEAEASLQYSRPGKNRRKRDRKKKEKKLKKSDLYDYDAFCELMKVKYNGTDPLCFTAGVDANCPGNPIPPKPTNGGPIDPCNP